MSRSNDTGALEKTPTQMHVFKMEDVKNEEELFSDLSDIRTFLIVEL